MSEQPYEDRSDQEIITALRLQESYHLARPDGRRVDLVLTQNDTATFQSMWQAGLASQEVILGEFGSWDLDVVGPTYVKVQASMVPDHPVRDGLPKTFTAVFLEGQHLKYKGAFQFPRKGAKPVTFEFDEAQARSILQEALRYGFTREEYEAWLIKDTVGNAEERAAQELQRKAEELQRLGKVKKERVQKVLEELQKRLTERATPLTPEATMALLTRK